MFEEPYEVTADGGGAAGEVVRGVFADTRGEQDLRSLAVGEHGGEHERIVLAVGDLDERAVGPGDEEAGENVELPLALRGQCSAGWDLEPVHRAGPRDRRAADLDLGDRPQ